MTLRRVVVALLAGWLAACGSDSESPPSREACAQLRAHVADLLVAQGSATLGGAEQEKHRSNLAATGSEAYVDACVKDRSERYVECALAARNLDEMARCRN